MSDKNLQNTEKQDLKDKLVYSNSLGGYILDVPEELRDKILVNHFGNTGNDCHDQISYGMNGGCGGNSMAKADPCGNICSGGQMICRKSFFF